MKRWLLVLAVLAVAVGLGAFTLYSPAAQKKEAPASPKLFSFAGDDVTEITIAGTAGTFTLRQTASQPTAQWTQVAPEAAAVDAAEASFYADQLAGLTADRELTESPSELKQYGLDTPELTVTVKLKDGSRHTLYVGAEAPVSLARYATVDDKTKVYLLAGFTADQLKKKPADFRPPHKEAPQKGGNGEVKSGQN